MAFITHPVRHYVTWRYLNIYIALLSTSTTIDVLPSGLQLEYGLAGEDQLDSDAFLHWKRPGAALLPRHREGWALQRI